MKQPGTFRTRYTPPAIPKSVLDHFATHPFTWSWTTKSGPNAGKSFPVPYIPTFCRKSDNQSVRWTVDLFHSFKAHLSPQLLDAKGRVPTPLVRIYQSNMLIHFHRQASSIKQLPKPASIPPPPPPPPKQRGPADPPAKPTTELERLRAEVTRLRKWVADLLSRHQASPPIPSISPLRPPPRGPYSSPPDPATLSDPWCPTVPGFPDQPRFQRLLDHPSCPVFVRSICTTSTLTHVDFVPEDATQLCQVDWHESGSISREYYAITDDTMIFNAPNCNAEVHPDVILTIWLEDADSEEEEESVIFQV